MKKITFFLFFAVFLWGAASVNAQSTAQAFKQVTEAFTQVLDSASIYDADWMGSTNNWADRSNDCGNPSGRYFNLSQNNRNMTFKVSHAASFTLSVANSSVGRQWNYSINGATPVVITHPGTGCVDTPVAIDDPGEVTIVVSSPSASSASVYPSKISFTPVADEPVINDCDYFEDFTNPATVNGTLGAVPGQFDYLVDGSNANLRFWCNAGANGNRSTTFSFNNPNQTIGFSKKASVEFDWAVRNLRAGGGEAFLAFRDDSGQTIFVLSTLSVTNNNAAPIQVGVGPISETSQPVVPASQKTQLASAVQTGAGTAANDGEVGVPWYHVSVTIDLIQDKAVTFVLTGTNGTSGTASATVPLTAGFALVNGIKDIEMGVSRTQACYWGSKITNICIKNLDATIPDTPDNVSIDLTSGQNNQAIGLGNAITDIVYTWGGEANAANVVWTPAGTPDGITVTPDATAKTVTISGTPTVGGTYSYSITSTDGTVESAPLTGTITAIPNSAGGGMPKGITTFVPSDSHYYRIICYGSSTNSSANTSGAAKYLTITANPGTAVPESNGASVLTTTTAFDASDRNIVWEITPYPEKDGYFIIKNVGTNSYFSSAGAIADAIVESSTADDFAIPYATTGPTISGNDYSYFRIDRESGPKQIRPSSFNGRWYWDQGALDRADMVFTIVPVNKSEFPEVTDVPTIALTTSGANVQTITVGDAIADIVYTWGGSATEANVTWTSDVPAGVTVTPDAEAKTVTISGTPEAAGVYEYSISSTDGTAVSTTLTGQITVNSTEVPTLDLTSGSNEQTIALGDAITDIVYTWGNSATEANVTWTPAGTPDGITVTPDATAKTVTISGTPASIGTYSYSITSTDGTAVSDPLTGKITVNNKTVSNFDYEDFIPDMKGVISGSNLTFSSPNLAFDLGSGGQSGSRTGTYTLGINGVNPDINGVDFEKKGIVEFDYFTTSTFGGTGPLDVSFQDASNVALFIIYTNNAGSSSNTTTMGVAAGPLDSNGEIAGLADAQKKILPNLTIPAGNVTGRWLHIKVSIDLVMKNITFDVTNLGGDDYSDTETLPLPAGYSMNTGIKFIVFHSIRTANDYGVLKLTNLGISDLDSEVTGFTYDDFMAYVATVQAVVDAETSDAAFIAAIKAILQAAIDAAKGSVNETSSETEINDAKTTLDDALDAFNTAKAHFTALQSSINSVTSSYSAATARVGTKFLNYSQTALDILNTAIATANNALATVTTTDALDAAKTAVESALATFNTTGRVAPLATPYKIYSYGLPNSGAGDGAKRFLYNDGTNTWQKLVSGATGDENDLWKITKGTTGYLILNTLSGKYLAKTSNDLCQTDDPTEVTFQDGKDNTGAIFIDEGFFLNGIISGDAKALELNDDATYTVRWNNGYADRARFTFQFEEYSNEGLLPVDVTGDQVIGIKYYNLLGVEIQKPVIKEVYITKKIYKSGKIEVVKAYDLK